MTARALWLLPVAAGMLWGQAKPCACGANPPGPPTGRELKPYANAPEDLRPFSKFTKPYYENYTKEVEYNGAAREVRTVQPGEVDEVRIGFLGPIENHPDEALGKMMLAGAQMAIDEANASGGYGGKPFHLMVHNDQATWGASSNEIVKMAYDEKVWAMLGSISGDSTHIGLRVSLKSELPIVNSAATDPTIPETIIPWYFTTLQDDRVQCYTLARRIYSDLGLKRIAILRINDRYGRFGVLKFKDASRRLQHPVIIEQKFMSWDEDFSRPLRIINESRVDGIVLWADGKYAGKILKQMRELGMKQPVFGSFRTLTEETLKIAGTAAEGFEAVFPYDPTRDDPAWVAFNQRFQKRFDQKPEAFASLGYDTMSALLDAVCRAGLNRGKIRDALYSFERYKGVTGEMIFDPNAKNIAPLFLAAVKDGKVRYRRYPMDKPYARVGDGGVSYAGPPVADAPAGPLRIGVFGPQAQDLAASLSRLGRGRYEIVGVNTDAPWGRATGELVKLIYERQALGVVATDRNSAHLAEQLAVKAFLPVIALSTDRTLTSVNIPWIFRMPADSTVEDAVRALIEAADKSGPNRARLRETLASGQRFESTGEPR